ncbi:MAG: class I tRNA ligase family protein, partial [Candidatus Peribacteraceae bacterium]|nr:class I tRNA ligase family protein [Candidatus Peribacteraceae bacterium]
GYKNSEADGNWLQDPDTLDTWFSSAMWTWSTLVDKEKALDMSMSLQDLLDASPEYKKFHPTSVMETGYDIIFFWVARMILMTTYATGQIPFETVYLHGLVRTRDGKKMSKSNPETCIDPLEIIPKYGADALRLSMIVGQSPGNDFRLYEEKIGGYRNFVNKLWNASRFVLLKCEEANVIPLELQMENGKWKMENFSLADKALSSSLQDLIDDVTNGLNEYKLSEVGERLYSFTWDFFCDWYLEVSKGEANCEVLVHALRTLLILLHPYCPFVTEQLWSEFAPKDADKLIKTAWPKVDSSLINKEALEQFNLVVEVISTIRKLRTEQSIEPGKKVNVQVYIEKENNLLSQKDNIERMTKCSLEIVLSKKELKTENVVSSFLQDLEIHIPLEGVIDLDKEREKLNKEKVKLLGFLKGIEGKLGNKQFMDNAPKDVVEKENAKKVTAEDKLKKIEERLKALGK